MVLQDLLQLFFDTALRYIIKLLIRLLVFYTQKYLRTIWASCLLLRLWVCFCYSMFSYLLLVQKYSLCFVFVEKVFVVLLEYVCFMSLTDEVDFLFFFQIIDWSLLVKRKMFDFHLRNIMFYVLLFLSLFYFYIVAKFS